MGLSIDTIVRILVLGGVLGLVPARAVWQSEGPASPAARLRTAEAPALPATLEAFDAPSALPPVYGLAVVAVADLPPAGVRTAGPEFVVVSPPADCPVQVRAIVVGSDGAESFAVIAHGEDSRLLHPGEGARLGESFVALTEIKPGTIELRRGGSAYTCTLVAAPSLPR